MEAFPYDGQEATSAIGEAWRQEAKRQAAGKNAGKPRLGKDKEE